MPVLFIGHGNPMHALAGNDFTRTLAKLSFSFPRPRAILSISAHWLSAGTWVTHMTQPKTIHDFYGFPDSLFEVSYPAPGSPALAKQIKELIQKPVIQLDESAWGLDHGTWTVLKHLYPKADIPVVQLSLDMSESAAFHLELGEKLRPLRDQGVLIVGSGNIVHNLRLLDWSQNSHAHPWALEFDQAVKDAIEKRNTLALTHSLLQTASGQISVPTPDHYLPLLYVFGASDVNDRVTYPYEGFEMGALSMRCVCFAKQ